MGAPPTSGDVSGNITTSHNAKKPQKIMASVAKAAPLKKAKKCEDGARFVPSCAADRNKMRVFCAIKGWAEFTDKEYNKFIANTPVQGVIRWMKDVKLAHAVLISLFSEGVKHINPCVL